MHIEMLNIYIYVQMHKLNKFHFNNLCEVNFFRKKNFILGFNYCNKLLNFMH